MRTPKIYLETTMFNYYFDSDRDAHADTVTLFEECSAGEFEPYTSTYIVDEIEDTKDADRRGKMLALIDKSGITILAANYETDALAQKYIAEGALPPNSLMDASHIAAAAVNALDKIVSLNFRHIVRDKTIKMTGAINVLLGYNALEISSPMEVIDSEKTRYHLGRDSRDAPQAL
ncbi:MAG: PIN domain nuclease [Oscillospiraceae bacterium]|jgi:predicted nucleic acid-binding protein|nr:PIN domain nuclease [Oscillospiraceae bacterium]